MIKQNITKIKETLPNNITILAATKTRTVDKILEAIEAGITIIGENYAQEAESKYEKLKGRVKIHCIGHLQTNKVKKAVKIFDCIQTIDSLKLAKEINKEAKKINKIMPVFIEINIAKEPNKTGCMPEDAKTLAEKISKLENLRLEGIMTMAPFLEDNEKARPYFRQTKQIFDKLNLKELSMGMSHSYKTAIEEGATIIRLGTIIFGPRNNP